MRQSPWYKAFITAASVVLWASTIMGGLWVGGLRTAIVVVLVGLLIFGILLLLEKRRSFHLADLMSLHGFAYPPASWLQPDDKLALTELAKAGLLLLAFDRSRTGCWGKTYMYRRAVSKSDFPLAHGSLTGTPFSLVAIGSLVDKIDPFAHDWAYEPISRTFAQILTNDGTYLRGRVVGQMGIVPRSEPLRHTAGGCLTNLLFRDPDTRDLKTLEILCTSPIDPMAWDKALVACTLLHASQLRSVPKVLRKLAKKRHEDIIKELVASGENERFRAKTWADPYEYGVDVNNQWATVWALIPSLTSSILPDSLRRRLESVLRDFLVSQSRSVQDGPSLLPRKMESSGEGTGTHVFGTTMAVVAWRTLELYGIRKESSSSHSKMLVKAILKSSEQVIKRPAESDPSDPLALEGYFAWAGICISAATLGIRVPADDCRKILSLSTELDRVNLSKLSKAQLSRKYSDLITGAGLFTPEVIGLVAKSCANVSVLYKAVKRAEKERTAKPLG